MCIRDRFCGQCAAAAAGDFGFGAGCRGCVVVGVGRWDRRCLLYTSDAADERSSVDLGGRRIIKKKKMT